MDKRKARVTLKEVEKRRTELEERRERLRKLYDRRLHTCRKAHDDGNLAGLYDALVICRRRDATTKREGYRGQLQRRPNPNDLVEVPRWVLDGTLSWLGSEMTSDKCPTARWVKQWKRDMRDFDRADAVQEARDHGVIWTDGQVYTEAAERLLPDQTHGQLEGSYKKVRRNMRETAGRYYISQYLRSGEKK